MKNRGNAHGEYKQALSDLMHFIDERRFIGCDSEMGADLYHELWENYLGKIVSVVKKFNISSDEQREICLSLPGVCSVEALLLEFDGAILPAIESDLCVAKS